MAALSYLLSYLLCCHRWLPQADMQYGCFLIFHRLSYLPWGHRRAHVHSPPIDVLAIAAARVCPTGLHAEFASTVCRLLRLVDPACLGMPRHALGSLGMPWVALECPGQPWNALGCLG